MKLYDLTHPLNNDSPVYPGKENPRFTPAALLQTEGYRETHLDFDSHLGTHIDAPAHMLENGRFLDQLPVSAFTGNALVIPVPAGTLKIDEPVVSEFDKEIRSVDFILFRTGWSRYWGSEMYYRDFPTLTAEALNRLLTFRLKGIGFDAISADPVESVNWENHFAIFQKEMIIIENLVFPDGLTAQKGRFYCFPLSYQKADGSPVRAVLETE